MTTEQTKLLGIVKKFREQNKELVQNLLALADEIPSSSARVEAEKFNLNIGSYFDELEIDILKQA